MNELRITGLASGSLDLDGPTAMAPVLDQISIDPAATHCTVASSDGSYTASIPVRELRDGGELTIEPPEQGGPIRLRVLDGSTLCWNVKDVGELRFTAGKEPDSVPANPPH